MLKIEGTIGFPGGLEVKNPPANAGDIGDRGLIPGSGRSPGGGNHNPLQYSCLGNPMDRGTWWATVHGVDWRNLVQHFGKLYGSSSKVLNTELYMAQQFYF